MNLESYLGSNYSNYKTSKSNIFLPKNNEEIFQIIDFATKKNLKILSIGSSLSWFDTIFNSNNIIISSKGTSIEAIKASDAVVGVNSMMLQEAKLLFKPVEYLPSALF